jgi:hypothetical protein
MSVLYREYSERFFDTGCLILPRGLLSKMSLSPSLAARLNCIWGHQTKMPPIVARGGMIGLRRSQKGFKFVFYLFGNLEPQSFNYTPLATVFSLFQNPISGILQ